MPNTRPSHPQSLFNISTKPNNTNNAITLTP